MSEPERESSAITALAEAWASIDGKLEDFERERGMGSAEDFDKPGFTGHYAGYMEEAYEMAKRLRKRGYVIMAVGVVQ